MGISTSKVFSYPYRKIFETGKRKIEEVSADDSDEDQFDAVIHSSKKRKLMSTSEYIYKTLFVEGRESDVTVRALDQQWHLHKVYLCQSPYFRSMFSGNWKEANASSITIEILDENITVNSLEVALGSLYKDDLDIKVSQVIPLLATAILLQMDSMIDQCNSIMTETINIKTVLIYRDAAWRYGSVDVERSCKNWLLHNLLNEIFDRPKTLRKISIPLMLELVSSPDLYVIQTEFSVYVMLKAWVFLKLNPSFEGLHESVLDEASNFFKQRQDKPYFLDDTEGEEFKKVFASVRLSHIILTYLDVEMLHKDRIFPPSWIQPVATQQWFHMLRILDQNEPGPTDVPDDVFNKMCTRCGRILLTNQDHIWRWTGFNFNLDLVMSYENSVVKLKRNNRFSHFLNNNSIQNMSKNVMFKVTVSSVNDQKQTTYTKTTGIKSVVLSKGEDIRILVLDKNVKYPLHLSASFLVVTPKDYPQINPVSDLLQEKLQPDL